MEITAGSCRVTLDGSTAVKDYAAGAKYLCLEGADKLPNGYYGTSLLLAHAVALLLYTVGISALARHETTGVEPGGLAGEVAAHLGERLLAVHHPCAGRIAQFLHHACGDRHVRLLKFVCDPAGIPAG